MQVFQDVLFFSIKTQKQRINSTYLVSVGCGRLAEGKGHETDSICLFFCFYVLRSLKKEDFFENLHVLSSFVQLKGVLLISCVFWILSQTQSKMVQIHRRSVLFVT